MADHFAVADWTGGNDGTGIIDSWALTFQTIDAASLALGAPAVGDVHDVRCVGLERTEINSGGPLFIDIPFAWTPDSPTVVALGNVTAIVGADDWIRPDVAAGEADYGLTPVWRVQGAVFAGGVTTITLYRNFYNIADAVYNGRTVKINTFSVLGVTQALAAAGQLLTGGWDVATQSQPDGWQTAYEGNATATGLDLSPVAVTHVEIEGDRLLFLRMGGANGAIYMRNVFVGCSITGAIDVSEAAVRGFYNSMSPTECEAILSCASGTDGIYSHYGDLRVGTAFIANCGRGLYGTGNGEKNTFGRLFVRNNTDDTIYADGGQSTVGHLSTTYGIRRLDTIYRQSTMPQIRVGELHTDGAMTLDDGVYIAQPAANFVWQLCGGIVDLVAGIGGGYGLRFDMASDRRISLPFPLLTHVEASRTPIKLQFWTYYRSVAGTPPTCWVELREPNGLTVQRYSFTPPAGAGWGDATQQTIEFEGTTSYDGGLSVWLCVQDNVDRDAFVYVDNIFFLGTGDVGWTGDCSHHGLDEMFVGTFIPSIIRPSVEIELQSEVILIADPRPFYIVQNDLFPTYVAALTDEAGDPIDLTTAIAVRFHMRQRGRTAVKIDAVAAIVPPAADGIVSYAWQGTDTDTAAPHEGEFEIEWAGGELQSVPANRALPIFIRPQLD